MRLSEPTEEVQGQAAVVLQVVGLVEDQAAVEPVFWSLLEPLLLHLHLRNNIPNRRLRRRRRRRRRRFLTALAFEVKKREKAFID